MAAGTVGIKNPFAGLLQHVVRRIAIVRRKLTGLRNVADVVCYRLESRTRKRIPRGHGGTRHAHLQRLPYQVIQKPEPGNIERDGPQASSAYRVAICVLAMATGTVCQKNLTALVNVIGLRCYGQNVNRFRLGGGTAQYCGPDEAQRNVPNDDILCGQSDGQ